MASGDVNIYLGEMPKVIRICLLREFECHFICLFTLILLRVDSHDTPMQKEALTSTPALVILSVI